VYDTSITSGSHGVGVTVYMIDTGCRTTHQELRGHATLVYTLFHNGLEDQHGHGTHTAGTVAGLNVGVANKVQLACLAVLDSTGTGTYSDVIGAMQWVGSHASVGPSIMSMSLGGTFSQAVNDQTAVLMNSGITCVSASGNSGIGTTCQSDGSGISPASTPGLIVAASSDKNDTFSKFDNFGSCITIVAPGESIISSWGSGDNVYAIASGTSMGQTITHTHIHIYTDISSSLFLFSMC
jgi:subtilisin family serine protease